VLDHAARRRDAPAQRIKAAGSPWGRFTSPLEHLAKFCDDLGASVGVEQVFRHSTSEPHGPGVGERLYERIRIGDGAVECMDHGHVLRALRFERRLRRIR